nr:hypothetical protein [Streptococcus sp. 11-4097]
LAFQNTPEANFDAPDIKADLEIQSVGSAKFDLTFEISESNGVHGTPDGLHGLLEFSTDLYKRETVQQLVERFILLLDDAAK